MASITDWINAITAIVIAVVAIIAIFQDKIRGWLLRPVLHISISMTPPDCHKIKSWIPLPAGRENSTNPVHLEADVYYFRLRIDNSGNQKAESVEVMAIQLLRQMADGSFKPVETFLPMNLVWSHTHEMFFPAISPGTFKHCDLAHVVNPQQRALFELEDDTWPNISREQTILGFDTIVRPVTKNNLVGPGKYRLSLIVAAANSKPITKKLEITLTGHWYDDEQKMLEEGIGIRSL